MLPERSDAGFDLFLAAFYARHPEWLKQSPSESAAPKPAVFKKPEPTKQIEIDHKSKAADQDESDDWDAAEEYIDEEVK